MAEMTGSQQHKQGVGGGSNGSGNGGTQVQVWTLLCLVSYQRWYVMGVGKKCSCFFLSNFVGVFKSSWLSLMFATVSVLLQGKSCLLRAGAALPHAHLGLCVVFQCVSGTGTLGSCFESRVVVVCEKMMSRACWAKSKHLIHSKTFRGMTLLHLAAAQGYATLIQTLIKWR